MIKPEIALAFSIITFLVILIRAILQWGKPKRPALPREIFAGGCLLGLFFGFWGGIAFYIVFSLYNTRFIH